jgi:hypothetical protein
VTRLQAWARRERVSGDLETIAEVALHRFLDDAGIEGVPARHASRIVWDLEPIHARGFERQAIAPADLDLLSVAGDARAPEIARFRAHVSDRKDAVREWLRTWYDDEENHELLEISLPLQQAVTRFYFRHAELAQYMCLVAGKIWKLQEVCDKPGAFPSTKQQNLLQKQLQDAVSNLVVALNRGDFGLPCDEERELYVMDHKTWSSVAGAAV